MDKQLREVFRKPTTRVKSIAFHPTQSTFLTGHHCGTLHIWDTNYAMVIDTIHEHVGSTRAVKFHPSGEIFATAGDDRVVRVWNYKTRTVTQRFRGHTDYIRSIDFHPTQPWLVSASDDYTLRIWNYYTGEQLCSSSGHSHYIMAVAFLDSTHIASASLDHTICLWNCSNLFERAKKFMTPGVISYQTLEAHGQGVNCLFYQDGLLVSGSDDREIKVWKYHNETLSMARTLYSQEGNVASVMVWNGTVVGGSEDGNCTLYQPGDQAAKLPMGARVWAVSGRDCHLAVGTDDGLVMYRRQPGLVYAVDGGRVLYQTGSQLAEYQFDRGASRVVTAVGSDLRRLTVYDGGRVVLQYRNKYDVLRDGRVESSGRGGLAYARSDGSVWTLEGGVLSVDGSVVDSDADGYMVAHPHGVLLVHDRTVRLFSRDTSYSFSAPFIIRDVMCASDRMALIGHHGIILLDQKFNQIDQITEKVEITGSLFVEETASLPAFFIYATLRNIKYYYDGVGVLRSVGSFCKPLFLSAADSFLFLLSGSGAIEKVELSLGELLFRRAVTGGQDAEGILSVIEQERLPGLAPLNYLIEKGKGELALPYIKDAASRFQLFMSTGNFGAAYELCDGNRQMYRELGARALGTGDHEIAEKCFRKLNDQETLFFLYLSTNQLTKLRELDDEDAALMASLVLEDRRVFHELLGTSADASTPAGEASTSTDKTPAVGERLSAMAVGTARPSSRSSSGTRVGTNPAAAADAAAAPSPASVSIPVSGPGLFDPSLVRPASVDDSGDAFREALSLTTAGKFEPAVGRFREILSFLAVRMTGPSDFVDLRRKAGAYIWALHADLERRRMTDPRDIIRLALFFSSAPLDEKHSVMARTLAMNLCYKHGNIASALALADTLPASVKAAERVRQHRAPDGDEPQDKYAVATGELCYDTMETATRKQSCRLCFVKSAEGAATCGACVIGFLE